MIAKGRSGGEIIVHEQTGIGCIRCQAGGYLLRDFAAEREIPDLHGIDRALPRKLSRGVVAHNQQSVRAPIAQARAFLKAISSCKPQCEVDQQNDESASQSKQRSEPALTVGHPVQHAFSEQFVQNTTNHRARAVRKDVFPSRIARRNVDLKKFDAIGKERASHQS